MGVLYSLYDALVSINVPNDKARAVIDAMEQDALAQLVTRSEFSAEMRLVRQEMASKFELLSKDVEALKGSLHHVRDGLEQKMDKLQSQLTVKLGSVAIACAGVLFGLLKLTA